MSKSKLFTDQKKNIIINAAEKRLEAIMKNSEKNILILCPFATVREFSWPLIALAKVLMTINFKITFVHCRKAMSKYCTGMRAKGLKNDDSIEKKLKFCEECQKSAERMTNFYPWQTEWLQSSDQATAVKSTIKANEIKKIASYEVILSYKIIKAALSKEAKNELIARYIDLKNLIPSAEKILKSKKYAFIISYNNLYGIHRLFSLLAKQYGLKCLCLHQSFDMKKNSEFILYKDTFIDFLKKILTKVKSTNTKKVNSSYLKKYIKSVIFSKKPWAYSKPPNKLNKKNYFQKKVLVVMSSPDEIHGLQVLGLISKNTAGPFSNQISWLKWVIRIAKKYPNVKFFIRPHPRLFPNRREGVISPIVNDLMHLKKQVNLANIIWPEQSKQGSVWDHLENTSIVFNAWSSVSDVFQFNNIPVLSFFPAFCNHLGYCNFTSKNIADYERHFKHQLQNEQIGAPDKRFLIWLEAFIKTNTFNLKWDPPKIIQLIFHLLPQKIGDKYKFTIPLWFTKINNTKNIKEILINT